MEWNGVSIEIQRSKLFLVLAMEMLEPASRGHNCPLCGGGGAPTNQRVDPARTPVYMILCSATLCSSWITGRAPVTWTPR